MASTTPIQPVCRKCGSPRTTRRERKSLLERTVFTWLGLFPWECNACWRSFLSSYRGVKRRRTPAQMPSPDRHTIAAD